MKSLILLCLVATALAAPWASQQQQQQQNRRRLQSLSVQLVDDDNDNSNRHKNREERREDRDKHDQQDRLDNLDRNEKRERKDQRDRYDQQSRNDERRYDDDRNDDQDRVDEQDRDDDDVLDKIDDQDRSDDRDRFDDQDRDDDEQDRKDKRLEEHEYRFEKDQRSSLRTSNLDALAQQMDLVASKYGSQGRIKVAYVPPSQRLNAFYHDLGSLNFRYIPSRTKEVQIASVVKPVLYYRPEDKSVSEYDLTALKYANPYLLSSQLRKQQIQQKRDLKEDDSDD